MKSSFPKRVKCYSRKWSRNANIRFKDCVLVKSFCICLFVYICTCKSFFPKRHKRHSKKMGFKCQCKAKEMCFGKELFIYIYIYMHIFAHFYEEFFPNLAFALVTRFLHWRLSCFEKELFTYLWRTLFPKHDLWTWHWHCNIDFWIGA